MALQSFQLLRTGGALEDVQRNIERVYVPLQRNPLLGGLLLPGGEQAPAAGKAFPELYIITAAGVDVPHTLPQAVRGWHVVEQLEDARIWRERQSAPLESLFLHLVSSATVHVKLYVF